MYKNSRKLKWIKMCAVCGVCKCVVQTRNKFLIYVYIPVCYQILFFSFFMNMFFNVQQINEFACCYMCGFLTISISFSLMLSRSHYTQSTYTRFVLFLPIIFNCLRFIQIYCAINVIIYNGLPLFVYFPFITNSMLTVEMLIKIE